MFLFFLIMIELRGLCKDFGGVRAVEDLDFVVNDGEVFGFLGPNSAGKTTTVRMLCSLLNPSSGSAFVEGLDELVNGYVSVNDWVLDLNVGGGWYYPYPSRSGIGADYSVSGSAEDSSNSQLLDLLQSETAGNIGSMNVSKFEELEDLSNQNWLTSIINFFTNLFK